VGRETKFGLLVGVVFIVLFGVILSSRAGSSAGEHAMLPTGESQGHELVAKTMNRPVDPFLPGPLSIEPGPAPVPVEHRAPQVEPMPAPEIVGEDTLAPAPVRPDQGGRIAFGPARVETPMEHEYAGLAPRGGDIASADNGRPGPVSPPAGPAALAGPIHVVRPGETLISIARKYGDVPWRAILEANRNVLRDEKHLAIGQKLVIPIALPAPRKDPPAPAPADTPRKAPPAPADAPRKDQPRDEAAADFMLAGRGTPAVREAAARDGAVREVTPGDLRRMLGLQNDLVEQPPAPIETYTVQPGDNFSKIAEMVYGDARYGRLLFLKNQHLVPDEKRMKIGQKILMLDGVDAAPPETAVAAVR